MGYVEGQTWQTNSGLMSASGTLRPAMQWLVGSGYLLE
jgi:endo-1,4-beta-xylanase